MSNMSQVSTIVLEELNRIVDGHVKYGDAPETIGELIDYLSEIRCTNEIEYNAIIKDIKEKGI